MISLLSILSKIPSHPIKIKSLFSSMTILTMLGSAIKTFGFPPNPGILASTSPNAC
jgi:hypothetical protein